MIPTLPAAGRGEAGASSSGATGPGYRLHRHHWSLVIGKSAFVILSLLLALLLEPVMAAPPEDAPPPREARIGLEEAIRLALGKNFVLKVDAYDPAIARAILTQARGLHDPRLTGSWQSSRDEEPQPSSLLTGIRPPASVTKTTEAGLALEGLLPFGTAYEIGGSTTNYRGTFNGFAGSWSTFAGITLTQPLLRGAGLNPGLYQIRLARTDLSISEWDYRSAVTNIVTQVIYAYSDLHLAQAQFRSALRSRDMALQLYNENEGRRRRGAMSEYDVLSARARVANREEGVLKAERGVRVAENALKQLISDGHDPEFYNWRPAIEPLPEASAAAVDPAAGFREALASRPDYRSARLGVKRSSLERRYQRNQLLPQVDLTGSFGYNGIGSDFASSRADARSRDFTSSSAGVTVSIPLASATERGRARAAALRLRQDEAALQRMEQDILVGVSNAAQQVETTRARVATTRTARELNEQMLDSELKRLRAGTGSTFNVLYQQEQLSGVEVAAAQAEADHRKALAEYDRQTGRTLAAHGITLGTGTGGE